MNKELVKLATEIFKENAVTVITWLENSLTEKQQKPLLIYGQQASGKTTFLKKVNELFPSEIVNNIKSIDEMDIKNFNNENFIIVEAKFNQ